jgi:DNA-binding NarL/FixJ family response regulator
MIRLLLVDDQPLVRKGLRRIFDRRHGFDVVGECDDGMDVEDVVAACRPDVVVMDVRMKGMDGARATRQLRSRPDAPPVLVLTTFDNDETIFESLAAGAAGFALKDASAPDLIRAVRSVAEGRGWLDETIVGRVLADYRDSVPPPVPPELLDRLTAREIDVLRLIESGATNAEIAAELHVSIGTVKTHLSSMLVKLGLRDRVAAVVFAHDHGLRRASRADEWTVPTDPTVSRAPRPS